MNNGFDKWYRGHPEYFANPSDGLVTCVQKLSLTPSPAIDIGCGQGRNALWLASEGYDVTAIDNSAEAIDFLQNVARARDLNINAFVADLITHDIEEEIYELAVVQTTLNHLEDPGAVPTCCSKISQCLAKDGVLYCVVFTTEDPGFAGKGDLTSETAGFVTYYFPPGELLENFPAIEPISYDEYTKVDESHGSKHLHGKAKLIGRKR